jgi:hypothetical protein
MCNPLIVNLPRARIKNKMQYPAGWAGWHFQQRLNRILCGVENGHSSTDFSLVICLP